MNVPIAPADPTIGGVILDLPYPPSINRIWRATSAIKSQRVYVAPSYQEWKRAADAALMRHRGWMMNKIVGPFVLDLALCAPKGHPRGDLDNRIKAVLDFLQRTTIVSNDKHCQRLCAYWVERQFAPEGARVTVKPWKPQSIADVLRCAEARSESSTLA